ncbi:hypothetical protein B566_EDAN008258 [Ephemera danica]|nr:hypothetical protein B566_EDAN008258 [Ephemera danica]
MSDSWTIRVHFLPRRKFAHVRIRPLRGEQRQQQVKWRREQEEKTEKENSQWGGGSKLLSRDKFDTKKLMISGNWKKIIGSCRFPSRWEGEWFQSGVRQPITIEGDRASSKGRCLASEGDKFLVVDDKGQCYRCVVIHEKHPNVLQYKETYCHGRSVELSSLCALITGDALLYSMFRVAASPVACPFRGSFSFSYNRGHGECAAPASSLQQCTEDWRVLLSFHACPDVVGTESSVGRTSLQFMESPSGQVRASPIEYKMDEVPRDTCKHVAHLIASNGEISSPRSQAFANTSHCQTQQQQQQRANNSIMS